MLLKFYRTALGKKIIVALSGLFLVFFIIGHMLGNLKFFGSVDPNTGQHALDHYAHLLRMIAADFLGQNTFIWLFRGALLVALFLHVTTVILLSRQNRLARSEAYLNPKYSSSTLASRYMMFGGLITLAFIIFHILHFTTGDLHFQGFVYGQVFNNVVSGFSVNYVVAIYIVSVLAVAFHIYHGAWSAFQTLGIDNPSWNYFFRVAAKVLAVVIFVGFASVPLMAAYAGYLPLEVK
jgi:succinate dehydrogenase / fumarate reductase cytochrome b subunit